MALFEVSKKSVKTKSTSPFIQPGQFDPADLKTAELIQKRRLQLLVHSCIYYDLNNNLIHDKQFDEWGRELVKLQHDYPKIAAKVCYAKAFEDWDATTGAFLPIKDKWVVNKAKQILSILKGENNVKKVSSSSEHIK